MPDKHADDTKERQVGADSGGGHSGSLRFAAARPRVRCMISGHN